MKKNETPAEINKRIMDKMRKAPKGFGEVLGKYEPVKPQPKKGKK